MAVVSDNLVAPTAEELLGLGQLLDVFWTGLEPRCRACGCTDDRACLGGCDWVDDDLCSNCAAVA